MLRTEKNWTEGVRKHSQPPSSKHQMMEEVRLSITPVVLDLKNEDINIFGIVKSACMTEWMNAIYKVLKQSRKELLLILFQYFQTPADPKFGCMKGFGGFCKVRCGMTGSCLH